MNFGAGRVYEIPVENWSREGGSVRFRAIPIYDSPILIAEAVALPLVRDVKP